MPLRPRPRHDSSTPYRGRPKSTSRTFGACPGFSDLTEPAAKIGARLASESVDGVVIAQGTGTIEQTGHLLDPFHAAPRPVAVTGAIRTPPLAGADGSADPLTGVDLDLLASASEMDDDRLPSHRYTVVSCIHIQGVYLVFCEVVKNSSGVQDGGDALLVHLLARRSSREGFGAESGPVVLSRERTLPRVPILLITAVL